MKRIILCVIFVSLVGTVKAEESTEWNSKICPDGILPEGTLSTTNPYDSKGQCYNYEGGMVQLLSRNTALFSKSATDKNPFAFINFGKASVPMDNLYRTIYAPDGINYYKGVVISNGTYSYTTVSGMNKIIFSFIPVPKSKEREARDERITKEKLAAKADKAAKIAAEAEAVQHWRDNNPTYTDLSNGLMWVRNGDIAGKRMQWDEAMKWVQNLNYGGYSDWRLPTGDELLALAQLGGDIPAEWFNINGFYNVYPYPYWTQDFKSHNGFVVSMGAKFKMFADSRRRSSASSPSSYQFVWPVRTIK